MMKKSCGKTAIKTFLYFSSLCCFVVRSVFKMHVVIMNVFMSCRWETIILISMYGIYIIIMKWVSFCHSTTRSIVNKDTISLNLKCVCVLLCVLCRFNRSLCSLVEGYCSREGQSCLSSLRRTSAVGNMGDCDNDMVPLKPGAWACLYLSVCIKNIKKFSQFLSSVQQT